MASVRFPNLSKTDINSFSEGQENVLTYILKHEKELNFVWRKIIQGVPSSVDETETTSRSFCRRTTAVRDYVCAGTMRKKNGKNSCLHNKKKIKRCLEDRNISSRGEKQYFTHSSKAFDTLPHNLLVSCLYLNYASVVKTPVS